MQDGADERKNESEANDHAARNAYVIVALGHSSLISGVVSSGGGGNGGGSISLMLIFSAVASSVLERPVGAVERVLAHGRARHGERAMSAAERMFGTSGRLMVGEVETLKVELAVRALDEPVDALVGQVGVEHAARHLERAGRAAHEAPSCMNTNASLNSTDSNMVFSKVSR